MTWSRDFQLWFQFKNWVRKPMCNSLCAINTTLHLLCPINKNSYVKPKPRLHHNLHSPMTKCKFKWDRREGPKVIIWIFFFMLSLFLWLFLSFFFFFLSTNFHKSHIWIEPNNSFFCYSVIEENRGVPYSLCVLIIQCYIIDECFTSISQESTPIKRTQSERRKVQLCYNITDQ